MWRAFCVVSDVALLLWVLFGASGCAFTPSSLREYTPAAAKLVDTTCVELRGQISDAFHAGKLAGDIALKRMERVNAVCDGAADAVDTVDNFTALVEEAKLWDSAK